ncbi:hypothetical protein FOA52_006735, partial [Chlamydomonas sp. UWO 241]
MTTRHYPGASSKARLRIWIQCHGASLGRFAAPFSALGVDGYLLTELTDEVLEQRLGVTCPAARAIILDSLRATLRSTANLNSTGNVMPTPSVGGADGSDAPELFTLPDAQLDAAWGDVFAYYDNDGRGRLGVAKTARLVAAIGLELEDTK